MKVPIWILSLFVIFVPKVPADDDEWNGVACPENWVAFEKSCYLLLRNDQVRWHEALQRCNETSAHLLSVNTMPEAKFISRLLTDADPTRKIWLTSGYLTADGSYEWSGDGNKFSFYYWHKDDTLENNYVVYTYTDNIYRWSTMKSDGVGYFICEIGKSQLGKLRDNVKSRDFGLTPVQSLNPSMAPRFVEEPSDTISYSNGADAWMELRCRAEGWPAPTYQWYKGSSGNYIDPTESENVVQIDGNLMFNRIVPTKDFGFYFCVASNLLGSIRSRRASLTSAYVKAFPSNRLDIYATEGSGRSVPCQAPDHFPQSMNYAWMYESVKQFLPETQRIFISSDGSLYFSHIQKDDRKRYSCTIVINELQAGQYGPFFTLKVDKSSGEPFAPTIPEEFPRVYPNEAQVGKSAWIECFAYGKPAPRYRWERLDKNKSVNNNSIVKNFGRKLYFPSLKNEDAGTYRCIVENSQGSSKKEITLTVENPPTFLSKPSDVIVEMNGSVELNCDAFGSPRIEYEWFKNGKPLNPLILPPQDQERIVIDYKRILIQKANINDSASYQCVASNSLGQISTSVGVVVKNVGATLTKELPDQLVYAFAGTNIILPCHVEALPTPNVTWLFKGRILNYGWQYALTKRKDLKVIQVAFVDAGTYVCSAANLFGASSISVHLTVLPALKLEVKTLKLNKNEISGFLCAAKSDSCPTCVDLPLQWTFNCQNVQQFSSFSTSFNESASLEIVQPAQHDLRGVLMCKTDSAIGQASIVVNEDIKTASSAPVRLKAINVTHNSATLTWAVTTVGTIDILGYKVVALRNNESDWQTVDEWVAHTLDTNGKLTVENVLLPNTFYQFAILAKNKIGWSRQSAPSNVVRTAVAIPVEAVEQLRVSLIRSNQILVEWKPLRKEAWADQRIGYIVEWILLNATANAHDSSQQSVTLFEASTTSYIVQTPDDPNVCDVYEVTVRAFNDQGRGPSTGPVTISSNVQLNVSEVLINDFYGIVVNDSSVNLLWSVTIEQIKCSQLVAYKLTYWVVGTNVNNAGHILVPISSNSSLVKELQPSTVYNFQLVPLSSTGMGNVNKTFTLKTTAKAPTSAPSQLTVLQTKAANEKVATLRWHTVEKSDEEPIVGYKLFLYESSSHVPFELSVLSKNLSPSTPSIHLDRLRLLHEYRIQVQSYSTGGYSPLSEPVIFRFGLNSRCSSNRTVHVTVFLLCTIFSLVISLL